MFRLLFIILLASRFFAVDAQEASKYVWKARHTRKVKLVDYYASDTALQTAIKVLFGNLIEGAQNGKVSVYRWPPASEQTMLSGEIKDIFTVSADTTILVKPYKNPTTGKEEYKEEVVVRERKFDMGWIQILQLVEDWEYDPSTGETNMKIVYVAPMRHVYSSETGEYRGTSSIFWIRWEKMEQWLDGYKEKQIAEYVYNSIWESYFKERTNVKATNIEKKNGQTTLKRNVTERVSYRRDTNILANRINVWGEQEERQLARILYDTLMGGRVRALDSLGGFLNKELSKKEVQERVTKTDTEIVIDPIDQSEIMQVKVTSIVNHVSSYSVMSEWALNLQAGGMSIQNLYVAPEMTIYDLTTNEKKGAQALFWMPWKDVFKATREYNSYNPEDNLEIWLWYDKFLSGKR